MQPKQGLSFDLDYDFIFIFIFFCPLSLPLKTQSTNQLIVISGSGSSSSSELSIGFLDVTFGKVSETLVVDDRDSTAATCALLGHQRSQGIFLGGSNVAVAMYPTSAGEWESTPILLSDVRKQDV